MGFEVAGFFGSISDNTQSYDLTSYAKFIYIFSSGLHYYYNTKHLVFIGYRYRNVFGGYSKTEANSFGFLVQPSSSFVVGYAYKF